MRRRRHQSLSAAIRGQDRIIDRFAEPYPTGRKPLAIAAHDAIELTLRGINAAEHPEDRAERARLGLYHIPPADAEDVLAGLAQISAAHGDIEQRELRMIHAARRRGASWEQIGQVLGYATDSARQGAQGRYKTLAARWSYVLDGLGTAEPVESPTPLPRMDREHH